MSRVDEGLGERRWSSDARRTMIYILYIRSPGLPITSGSPGQTVQSGRARPGPDVYKRKFVVLGISFSCPISIH
jgi:hypothetical protein